jgi:hypothetical protein
LPPGNPNASEQGVCLDGKYVRAAAGTNLTFTPAGNHPLWVQRTTGIGSASTGTAGFPKETLQMNPSGALLILSQDVTSFKRFSVAPSPQTRIAPLLGGAPGLPANH